MIKIEATSAADFFGILFDEKGEIIMIGKPFIKLLRSPNSGYFFDVNRNEIVPVDDDVYNCLESEQKGGYRTVTPEMEAKLALLRENGYLSSNKVKKIEHPNIVNLHNVLEKRLSMLCIQVTQNCNLRCEYCIYSESNNGKQRKHNQSIIDFETAKKAVRYLYERSKETEDVSIGFYGGEPLLAFDLIKQIVIYAEEIFAGRNLLFNTTTNATLLTPETAEFLYEHDFSLMISLDGPKEIHDKNRHFKDSGSFDCLLENVNYIAKKHPDYADKIRISMVIDRQNDFDEINSLFKKYPTFNRMELTASYIDETYSENKKPFPLKYVEKCEYNFFLAVLYNFGRLKRKNVSHLVEQDVKKLFDKKEDMEKADCLPEVFSPGGPCTAGARRLFCTVNGDLFPCERVSETSPVMRIGSLESGFDYEAVKNIMNVGTVTENECINCWAFIHCMQCVRGADGGDHIDREIRLANCGNVKIQTEHFLRNSILIYEKEYYYSKRRIK